MGLSRSERPALEPGHGRHRAPDDGGHARARLRLAGAVRRRRSRLRCRGEVGVGARRGSTRVVAYRRPGGAASRHARGARRCKGRRPRRPHPRAYREAQAVALQSLAGRHGDAADRLRTEFGTAARPLIAGLEDSRLAYAALATAASDGLPARYVAARRQVRVAEGELGDAIDRTRRAGARDTAAAAPPSPAATVTEPARPLVTQPILLILLLLGQLRRGVCPDRAARRRDCEAAAGPVGAVELRAARRSARPRRRRRPVSTGR